MEQKQIDIKTSSSEELALFMAGQFEQVNQCRNNIQLIVEEMQRRINEKNQLEKESLDASRER